MNTDIPDIAQNCVLIGNGPSVLKTGLGSRIDAFDEVIRFNKFKIHGFEQDVGTKTSLWATFGRGTLPLDPDIRPMRILYTHGTSGNPTYNPEVLYRIPLDFFNKLRDDVQALSKKPPEIKLKLLASSGLLVIYWLLEVLSLKKIHLVGFDNFQKKNSNLHHYWIPSAFKQPVEHDGEVEADLIQSFVNAGRIERL